MVLFTPKYCTISDLTGLEIFDLLIPSMVKKLVYASLWFTTVFAYLLMQR